MAIKNHIIHLKITKDMQGDLKKITDELGFKQTDLIRLLLNNAIQRLKSDSIKVGGFNKLEFTIREI